MTRSLPRATARHGTLQSLQDATDAFSAAPAFSRAFAFDIALRGESGLSIVSDLQGAARVGMVLVTARDRSSTSPCRCILRAHLLMR
ncbi:hypothetical protein [Variovorax sp. LT1R16]|uniref:hypothetical protein n=1 Tax=Variovorax sp. LT1R16 TaxID=3443728 RepID=UPI003F48A420